VSRSSSGTYLRKIISRGYRKVYVQYHVGRYRIDIAVECDGDRWHGPDIWHRDRARQEVLERANWTFERIRGSAFYRDPDAALRPLWQRLADLSIPTGDWWSTETPHSVVREVSGPGRHHDPAEGSGNIAPKIQPEPETAALDANAAMAATSATVPAPIAPLPEPVVSATDTTAADEAKEAERSPRALSVFATEPPQPPHPPVSDLIGPSLLTYQAWLPHPLPHPDSTSPSDLVTGLVEIVAAQGPMHAQHAYRVYTQAAGGHRVGTEIRRALYAATRIALRTGALDQLNDDLLLPYEKTLYAVGQPPVLLRELGTRQLPDIPRSKITELIKLLNLADASADEIKRAVLNTYGLIRLTNKTSLCLDDCLSYRWRE
jgi:hypothetical protein